MKMFNDSGLFKIKSSRCCISCHHITAARSKKLTVSNIENGCAKRSGKRISNRVFSIQSTENVNGNPTIVRVQKQEDSVFATLICSLLIKRENSVIHCRYLQSLLGEQSRAVTDRFGFGSGDEADTRYGRELFTRCLLI